MTESTSSADILWDSGTAYELFISLHVLHEPDSFGIRPSYAAGVRSRIPAVERKLLEDIYPFSGVPLKWLHSLPAPKAYFASAGNLWYHDDHSWSALGQVAGHTNSHLLNIFPDLRFISSDAKSENLWIITGNNELTQRLCHQLSDHP